MLLLQRLDSAVLSLIREGGFIQNGFLITRRGEKFTLLFHQLGFALHTSFQDFLYPRIAHTGVITFDAL